MSTTRIIVAVAIVVVIMLLISMVVRDERKRRTRDLRDTSGPEYDRTLKQRGDRGEAEAELKAPRERRQSVNICELDPVRRAQYERSWQDIQSRFVDDPGTSVINAQRLVRQVMAERGYPTDIVSTEIENPSVDHGEVVTNYRITTRISDAHERDEAGTEELREAMIHYRSLFGRLLGETQLAREGERLDRSV
ncbi:MAG: hypothetical protein ABI662_01160 [Dermatophilaceae bacterium]